MVEAYKASTECHHEKLASSELAFAKGMDNTRRRIIKCYLGIDLHFLDEENLVNDTPHHRCSHP